ncbi:MAG: hypothetical protein FIB08_03745 [Candidatus Methanoperedens sp.]|nr:hypothetical protein [Candidatus Methanoperedens sp.]
MTDFDSDRQLAWQIFKQYREEYKTIYQPLFSPEEQENCEAQWSKSSVMLKRATTQEEVDIVLTRAKKLLGWCKYKSKTMNDNP